MYNYLISLCRDALQMMVDAAFTSPDKDTQRSVSSAYVQVDPDENQPRDLSDGAARTPSSLTDRVPDHILEEIFTLCLPCDDIYLTPTPGKAPLLLTQVCRDWRYVALETSVLWSSISVVVQQDLTHVPSISLVETWLARSRTRPLSLRIHEGPAATNMNEQCPDGVNAVLALYLAHRHRWRALHFNLCRDYGHGLLPIPAGGAQQLEQFDITLSADSQAVWMSPIFHSLPRLRTLNWEAYGWVSSQPSPATPWSQLTHLKLCCFTLDVHPLDIMGRCPRLIECALLAFVPFWEVRVPPSFATYVFPELRSLTVDMVSAKFLGSFFDRLVVPALSTLSLASRDCTCSQWPQSQFMTLLSRSLHTIESLSFLDTPLSEDDLLEALHVTSGTLKELGVKRKHSVKPSLTDRTLGQLTFREVRDTEGSCLASKLEKIDFVHCLSSTDGVLADMVQSRLQPSPEARVARLTSIKIDIPISGNTKNMSRLARLRGEWRKDDFELIGV